MCFSFSTAKLWFPDLVKTIVHSEILDKYLSVVVTDRTLWLIDQHKGFDNYILETPVQDFKSQLALHLRRRMLVALARGEYYKDNPDKHKYVYEKYKQHLMPVSDNLKCGVLYSERFHLVGTSRMGWINVTTSDDETESDAGRCKSDETAQGEIYGRTFATITRT